MGWERPATHGGRFYAASQGLAVGFEVRVAAAIGAFLEAINERRLFVAVVYDAGHVPGSMSIDGTAGAAALVHPA